jgi:hypothetical protein
MRWIFSIDLFLGVTGGGLSLKADNLTAICLENVGASTSHNRMDLHGLLQAEVYLK